MEHLYKHINIVSFASCYLIAFVFELLRCRWRTLAIRPVILLTTLAGLIANTVYISYNFLFRNDRLITSMGGWFFVLALALAVVHLYSLSIKKNSHFGLLLQPMIFVLLMVGYAVRGVNFPEHETGVFICGFHGIALLLSAFFLLSGFIFGVLYFLQKHRLKKKTSLSGALPLPSLETLVKLNLRSLRISAVFLGLGILSGFYIKWILYSQGIVKSGIYDPMILGALTLFILMTIFLHLISLIPWFKGGEAPAVTAIGSFVFFFAFLILGLFFSGNHWKEISPTVEILPSAETASPAENPQPVKSAQAIESLPPTRTAPPAAPPTHRPDSKKEQKSVNKETR